MKHNMQILQEMAVKNGPLCVGLDTDPSYLPLSVLSVFDNPAQAVLAYNKEIIKSVERTKSACCFKVQIAYYEAMGLAGMEVYKKTLDYIKETGIPVISDIKRGDIAATAGAYAKAHFSGDFETDIITVNPYMGFDTLTPFAEYCATSKGSKGIFVLLRTSNPGMVDIEQQELKSGDLVLEKVGSELERLSSEWKKTYPEQTCSPIGAVVGCTEESDAKALRAAYPDIFFLIPGYGAQGGAARIAATLLLNAGGTVNSSRGILCAWKKDSELEKSRESGTLCLADIAKSAEKACLSAKEDLLNAKKSLLD
ncbi:MAG: orotidine-5'-phosphate decarboxylase [Treponema sp.]|nr:orotidine-5'-phosphate decarboxylase [Treponema sp.]